MIVKQAVWFYAHGDRSKGPFTAQELSALLRTSTVNGETPVFREGFEGWKPLKECEEFQHWASPVIAAFAESPAPSTNAVRPEQVTCSQCGRTYAKHHTKVTSFGKRLCKLCSAADKNSSAARAAAAAKAPSSLSLSAKLSLVAAVLIIALIGGASIAIPMFDLPNPLIDQNRWVKGSPEEWPPLLCAAEFRDNAGARIISGNAFVIESQTGTPFTVTASRKIMYTPQQGRRSTDQVNQLLAGMQFLPFNEAKGTAALSNPSQPRTLLENDVLMISASKSPAVKALKLRPSQLRKGMKVTLVASPAEVNGPQRRYTGTVVEPGSELVDGVISMDDVFPADWFIGSPFLDDRARVIGMLNGERPVDLSSVESSRNLLTFVPAERLRKLAQ